MTLESLQLQWSRLKTITNSTGSYFRAHWYSNGSRNHIKRWILYAGVRWV